MGNANTSVTVLGAGSWGTALALALAQHEQNIQLWVFDDTDFQTIQSTGCNERYLPGISLPSNISVTQDLAHAVESAEDILLTVPSHAVRSTLEAIQPALKPETGLCIASKGLDPNTGDLLDRTVRSVIGEKQPLAFLSGPSFAKEVANNKITAVAFSSEDDAFAQRFIPKLSHKTFRIYRNHDLTGTQIGGFMKNVIAIAAGIVGGLELGPNTHAALLSRALTEMIRLGLALGAQAETLSGLTGLGDLILTCGDNLSRNRRFGMALAQGQTCEEALKSVGQVVEGYQTADLLEQLAQKHQVSLPICHQTYRVLYEGVSAEEAIDALLDLPAVEE